MDQMREAFEQWAKTYMDGLYKQMLKRDEDGTYYWRAVRDSWTAWQAAWNARALPAVPAGFKLVPVEPTRAMILAGAKACTREDYPHTYRERGQAIDCYTEMIAAIDAIDKAQGDK